MNIEWGSINYLAVVAGMVINMALGALWYSPVLFAKPWMAANNLTEEEIRAKGTSAQMQGYAVAAVGALIFTLALAIIWQLAGITELLDGLILGLVAAIGLIATTQLAAYMFEGRPFKLYLINIGYSVVSFALIGMMLAVW